MKCGDFTDSRHSASRWDTRLIGWGLQHWRRLSWTQSPSPVWITGAELLFVIILQQIQVVRSGNRMYPHSFPFGFAHLLLCVCVPFLFSFFFSSILTAVTCSASPVVTVTPRLSLCLQHHAPFWLWFSSPISHASFIFVVHLFLEDARLLRFSSGQQCG